MRTANAQISLCICTVIIPDKAIFFNQKSTDISLFLHEKILWIVIKIVVK